LRDDSDHVGEVLDMQLYYDSFPYIKDITTSYIQWAKKAVLVNETIDSVYNFNVYVIKNRKLY
jgi:hypothetical protein